MSSIFSGIFRKNACSPAPVVLRPARGFVGTGLPDGPNAPGHRLKDRRGTPVPTGWCYAQRIKISMLAGGKHTIIYNLLLPTAERLLPGEKLSPQVTDEGMPAPSSDLVTLGHLLPKEKARRETASALQCKLGVLPRW